ncbi:MAG: aminoacyl-tRNA hydrolase [Clostridia bacterium]|nr:aminoacyl-tRNA hydrolase [Clostridia bacterium]
MFFSKKSDYTFLLVCLGNPGRDYARTRHNTGFLFAQWLKKNKDIKIRRAKFDSLYGEIKLGGRRGLIVTPQTFMNLSGTAVKGFAKAYEIQPSDILVVCDDINFAVGQMRIKRKGSSGGQKGVGSIIEQLGTEEFPRIKIGVGGKAEAQDLKDYVLSDFSKKDIDTLAAFFPGVYDAADLIIGGKIDDAMQKYN